MHTNAKQKNMEKNGEYQRRKPNSLSATLHDRKNEDV